MIKELFNPFKRYVGDQFVHSISLSSFKYQISFAMTEVFNNLQEAPRERANNEEIVFEPDLSSDSRTPLNFVIYHGVPIWVTDTEETCYSNNYSRPCHVPSLNTINNKHCIKVLHEFIEKLYKRNNLLTKSLYAKHTNFYPSHRTSIGLPYRTFDDIFVAKDIKDVLINNIDSFISRKEWYKDHNIPYHYGIMLHGAPGTGKSVLAQAISEYLGAMMYVISGDRIFDLPDLLGRDIPTHVPDCNTRIILCEDIDCGLDKSLDILKMMQDNSSDDISERGDFNTKRKAGFSSLLNAIDGLGAPDNIIYIFTTNHIENIDPALIRPGRIDLKLEIGYVTRGQFDEFTQKYFNKVSDESFDIKDGMTFALIQNEMMKDASFEDIINFVRKE